MLHYFPKKTPNKWEAMPCPVKLTQSQRSVFQWGGYKRIGKRISFADIEVKKSLENNRSVTMMEKINKTVTWENIEALLLEYYGVGRNPEGADAYPSLMLLKCLLLQKWFHIPSDPELENLTCPVK